MIMMMAANWRTITDRCVLMQFSKYQSSLLWENTVNFLHGLRILNIILSITDHLKEYLYLLLHQEFGLPKFTEKKKKTKQN